MMYAICIVPVAHIRVSPDHRAEMSSQLLFGEKLMIAERDKKGWIKISCKADGYEGWCQLAQFGEIDAAQYNAKDILLTEDWVNEVSVNGQPMFVPLGSLIDQKDPVIRFAGKLWNVTNAKKDAATIQQFAFKFLNTAYLWGGRSVFAIDCSGFAQTVYKFLNIPLLRDAKLQATEGELVHFLQEARCGDLAFFDDAAGEIIHVGILLNEREIIHASGKVRVDTIDNGGITNVDTGERTHQLRIIKRYF
jgi:hypothetical protein